MKGEMGVISDSLRLMRIPASLADTGTLMRALAVISQRRERGGVGHMVQGAAAEVSRQPCGA